jgi:hypothetical protein
MPVCGDILHNYYINPGGWRNTTRRAHKCQPLLSLGSETASQHPPCWGHIDSERKFLYCGFYLLVSNVRIQTPAGIASKTGQQQGQQGQDMSPYAPARAVLTTPGGFSPRP